VKNTPEDLCRNCNHIEWLHDSTFYWACGRKPRNNHDAEYASEICPCKEFVPTDNLEFLEYKLDKKNASR
jgi:hypothetical protein